MKNAIFISTALTVTRLVAGQVAGPQITLDYGTFLGVADSKTGTDNFLGIPFATAGRLQNPTVFSAANKLAGLQDATSHGPTCPQQVLIAPTLSKGNAEKQRLLANDEVLTNQNLTNQAEDCLSINIQVPQGYNSDMKLPVMMWIPGDGYELGSSGAVGSGSTVFPGVTYQGANYVARSVQMSQPVIFVSANYRLNAFGSLAAQEITDAGIANLLLKDQRTAMHWVQNYIQNFGGDPSKVMIFGESSGSIAVAIHMLLNNGNNENLFRAAIMLSGGASKLNDYHRGQSTFDSIVSQVGCGSATDKITCLRQVPYDALYKAVQEQPSFLSYESSALSWYPRPDGTYLKDSPHRLLRTGKVANIPYIIGDMKDQSTIFSLVNQLNITNDVEFQQYINTVYFPNATAAQIQALISQYKEDSAAGSSFDTGTANALGFEKRLAAIIGDYNFQAPRRDLLNYTSALQNAWTYQIESSIPVLPGLNVNSLLSRRNVDTPSPLSTILSSLNLTSLLSGLDITSLLSELNVTSTSPVSQSLNETIINALLSRRNVDTPSPLSTLLSSLNVTSLLSGLNVTSLLSGLNVTSTSPVSQSLNETIINTLPPGSNVTSLLSGLNITSLLSGLNLTSLLSGINITSTSPISQSLNQTIINSLPPGSNVTSVLSGLNVTSLLSGLNLASLLSGLNLASLLSGLNVTSTSPVSQSLNQTIINSLPPGVKVSALLSGLDTTSLLSELNVTSLLSGLNVTSLLSGLNVTSLLSGLNVTSLLSGLNGTSTGPVSQSLNETIINSIPAGLNISSLLSGLNVSSLLTGLDVSSLLSGLSISSLPPALKARALPSGSGLDSTNCIMSTFIAFANNLDPNTHGLPNLPLWPKFDNLNKKMFQFSEQGPTVITDDFRQAAMELINQNGDTYLS